MGLFRRARKKREHAPTGLPEQLTAASTAPVETAPEEVVRRDVIPEARPNPDQPGWGRALGEAIGKSRVDHQE
jgi:hypothetical protein